MNRLEGEDEGETPDNLESPLSKGDGANPVTQEPSPVDPALRSADKLELELRRLSRRGFGVASVAAVAGYASWKWLVTRNQEEGLPWPLRRTLEWNERIAGGVISAGESCPAISSPRRDATTCQRPDWTGVASQSR